MSVTLITTTGINSELNTSWNTGVIAKPTFKEGFEGDRLGAPNVIFTSALNVDTEPADLTNTKNNATSTFEIAVWSDTEANGLLIVGEIRRIIQAKSVTSGVWEFAGYIPAKAPNGYMFICSIIENIWVY